MGECVRCGACCRVIAVISRNLAPETREWLIAHGCVEDKKQDHLLIPHTCQHLDESPGQEFPTSCNIHDTSEYPLTCARYHGFGAFYKPNGCGYVVKE